MFKTDLIDCLRALLELGSQKYEGREGHATHNEHHHHDEDGARHLRLVADTDRMFPSKKFSLVLVQLWNKTHLTCIREVKVKVKAKQT
jgi:hypothetical protein